MLMDKGRFETQCSLALLRLRQLDAKREELIARIEDSRDGRDDAGLAAELRETKKALVKELETAAELGLEKEPNVKHLRAKFLNRD